MEENLHDDKLDDYVRKSFEDHEEDPPSDMWERVEGGLPQKESLSLSVTLRNYRWQAMAAAVILLLLSTLVCEHLYYEQKLKALSKPAESNDRANNNNLPKPQGLSEGISIPSAEQIDKAPASRTATEAVGTNAKQRQNVSGSNQMSEPAVARSTAKSPAAAKPPLPKNSELSENRVPSPAPFVEAASATEKQAGETNFETREPVLFSSKSIEIDLIAPRTGYVRPMEALNSPSPKTFLIKPRREPTGWYVGVQTSLLTTREKNRPLRPQSGRPAFATKQEAAGIAAIWWFKTGKKLGSKFTVESGIGYEKTTRTATHTPQFRFGEGTPHGPQGGMRRNFDYQINTYSGTADVSLRMEQTSPGAPLPDDEPVSLTIKTEQEIEMLRIPLLAGYRFGKGRLNFNTKAGLLSNIILKNKLDISARVSQNTTLRPMAGSDGYTLRLNQSGKFFLGYTLSCGAEFKMNRRISLMAGLESIGDFSRNDRSRRKLPQHHSVGFNLGANYYF